MSRSQIAEIAARTVAIVVAAGSSRRMDGQDKIRAGLLGRPVLRYSVDVLLKSGISRLVVVASPEAQSEIAAICAPEVSDGRCSVVPGGARRQDSVRAGLASAAVADWILVHDGARPLVTVELVQRGLRRSAEVGTVVAAIPVKDTIKQVAPDGAVMATLPRQSLWQIQTPQIFRAEVLRRAHEEVTVDVTDDAAQVEVIGHPVHIFPGDPENIKITTPEDWVLAEAYLRRRQT